MQTETDLQEVLRRNLRVLTAMRRMTQGELATRLGSDRSTIAKRMNGQREWGLQDLARLASVFDVTAQQLIGDTSALVAAVHPAATGTEGGVINGVSGRCPRTNPRVVIPFPQAGRSRRGYHRNWRPAGRPARTRTTQALASHSDGHAFAAVTG